MKFASFLITTIFAMSAFAMSNTQAQTVTGTIHTRIIGHVVFEKNHTMTCMATNCPPSLPYFQLVLDDAQVDGIGPVESVVFEDFEKIMGSEKKPTYVVYGGVSLKEGMYIVVEADVRVSQAGNKVYAVAANPVEVKLAPARFPVMLY